MRRVGIVVNAAGLQERRAEKFAHHAARFEVGEIAIAPSPRNIRALARDTDIVYIIDAGKRGFAGFVGTRLLGVPCVVEIGDPQAILYRSQGRGGMSVAVGTAIDRIVMLAAHGIVVRGRALAEDAGLHGSWTHLPDGVDLERFTPVDPSELRSSLGIDPSRLVVGVVGSISWSTARGWCYGMEIVEALGQLRDLPVEALIVGDGTGLEHLRRRAVELGVADRVHTVGRVPHGQVPVHIAAMDVCVSTQTDDPVGRGRTTAKLPEYLACDRFVLATRVGEAARLLPPEMLVPYKGLHDPGYPLDLASRVAALVPELPRLRAGGGTRALATELYDYRELTRRWEAFLDHVLTPKGASDGLLCRAG